MTNPVNASYENAKTRSSWEGYATGQLIRLQDKQHRVFARVDAITHNDQYLTSQCPQNHGHWGLAYPALQTRPNDVYFNQDYQRTPSLQTLFDAMRQQLNIPNAFSYQLCPKHRVDVSAAKGLQSVSKQQRHEGKSICQNRVGHFWLGGYNAEAMNKQVTWVPLISNQYHYELHVDQFLVNGKRVPMHDINHPRTIIDTGTKDIVLSKQNLQNLLFSFKESGLVWFDPAFVSSEYEQAFWFNRTRLTLPSKAVKLNDGSNVAISLSGQKIDLHIENLLDVVLIDHDDETQPWINISLTGLSSHNDDNQVAGTILGNTFMRGKTTIWDRDQGLIGFTSSGYDDDTCCQPGSATDIKALLTAVSTAEQGKHEGHSHIQPLFVILIACATLGATTHIALFVLQYCLSQQKRSTA
ncbi:predicted protein [Lichtheimia corymbifera JMRC:FSU:9682]|uniref:Peptidase A1 domain-containing protein n=1 Tax=Lichtheimia corymbifera JMRC:FSU:9682 TaxID=1263082 RepID=A0A068S7Q4_9FUNG|nr:predicted protein [Lichtheimia corymbifera JMRC:FSU:9682]